MTKSTITDKRVTSVIERLEHYACNLKWTNVRGAQDLLTAADGLRELQERRKAAMDGEPVAWTWHYREQWHVTNDERRAEFVATDGDVAVLPLYRHAQPALVVPKEMTAGIAVKYWEGGRGSIESFVAGYNFCRAAMLAAAPQSPGSEPAPVPGKWMPVSERMPPPRYEVLVGRWWGEKPRWCCKWATYIPGHPDAQSSGWLIPGASWTPTHWMPLPAGPLEVKGE